MRDIEGGYRCKLGVGYQQKIALASSSWAAALRRGELATFEFRDSFWNARAVVTIRRSKRDQEGEGENVATPVAAAPTQCAVRALKSLARGGRARRGERLSKRRSPRNNRLEPLTVGIRRDRDGARGGRRARWRFRAHPRRSGFVTSAARGGFGEAAIMKHGRWKSVAVALRCTRVGNRWDQSVNVL